jgi:hypothetical protein
MGDPRSPLVTTDRSAQRKGSTIFLANSEEREVVETVYPFLWCLLGGAVYKRKLVLRQGDLQR